MRTRNRVGGPWIAGAVLGCVLLSGARAHSGEATGTDGWEAEVRATEEAFAKTMADRDHAAFVSFLAEEAVFVGREILRGRQAVADGWKRYYEGDAAPFSWKPERVAVLASGSLALSTGPVFDTEGQRDGTFVSTWRREDGRWRIVLDTGCPPCATSTPD